MTMQVIIPKSPFFSKGDHLFRLFNPKISGPTSGQTEHYIVEVQSFDKKVFGSRMHPWHEVCDNNGLLHVEGGQGGRDRMIIGQE